MKIIYRPTEGLAVIQPFSVRDIRGEFVKTYRRSDFDRMGMKEVFVEDFYSVSNKGVVRGMHYQSPPHGHGKLVYCVRGRALDVVVDLRASSSTFGEAYSFTLSEHDKCMLYMEEGFAHGFYAFEDETVMVYKTTSEYAPDSDVGIRYDSFGFCWPGGVPVVSARDMLLPAFSKDNRYFR